MNELTQEYVRELFDYRGGELYRKVSRANNKVKSGNLVGSDQGNGYREVTIDGKSYYIHRLIFLYHHGYLPEFLDHIDGDKSNNDILNLRGVTRSQNQQNSRKTKSYDGKPTSSRFKGVSWNKQLKKWDVRIQINGKRKYLGLYDYEIKAAEVYDRIAIEAFGEFVKPNFD